MAKRRRLDRNSILRKPTFLLLVGIAIALVVLLSVTGWQEAGNKTLPENVAGTVLEPVQRWVYSLGAGFSALFSPKVDEQTQLQELKLKVANLEFENQQLREYKTENETLRDMLAYAQQNPDLNLISANVTGKNAGIWFSTFQIDVGLKDGVHVDDVVITPQGVVGRVVRCGNQSCTVTSILDGTSAIAGIVERTRDNGIVKGNIFLGNEEGACRMTYLPLDTEIMPGDVVLTSGLGGIYPKGLRIGEVLEITSPKNSEPYALVQPYTDLLRLEHVIDRKSTRLNSSH